VRIHPDDDCSHVVLLHQTEPMSAREGNASSSWADP
jgi:hypothetical protein